MFVFFFFYRFMVLQVCNCSVVSVVADQAKTIEMAEEDCCFHPPQLFYVPPNCSQYLPVKLYEAR